MTKPTFQTALDALRDDSTAFPGRYLPLFSDLTSTDVDSLMDLWPSIGKKRKHNLLSKLVEAYQNDSLLSFDGMASALLTDPDEQIRAQALQLLVETDDTHLLPRLVEMIEQDPELGVRVQAARVLGNFVALGELDEIAKESLRMVEDSLLRLAHDNSPEIQRIAIESVGYSSRPEVETLIQNAYQKHSPQWVQSALVAMGRSANQNWEELILAKLSDPNEDVRYSAIRAAGELGLESARQFLLDLLEEEDDDGLFVAAVWALSQIGGEDVRVTLQALLDQAEEDELIEFLEEALDNLDLTDEMNSFDLFAIDPDDEPDETKS